MNRQIAGSESSSPPAEAAPLWAALAVGLLALALAWALLHLPVFERFQIIDTPVYQEYGELMAAGQVPYRDFAVEYPPAALPLFWLPTLAPEEHYAGVFEWLMFGCAAAALAFLVLALGAVEAPPARLAAAAAFAGLAPLALGPVVLSRYDFWPVALTAAALAAVAGARLRLGFAVLGVATAAKLYPALLLPVVLAYAWRRSGRREAAAGLGIFAAVLALVILPFAALAPGGLWDSLAGQLGRPLQIESLGAAVLLAAEQLGLYRAEVVSSAGSQNLAGELPDTLAVLLTLAQAAVLVAVWVVFARGRADCERLFLGAAAAVAASIAFAKVLSPQFLIWLIPLVPLVAGTTGLAAGAVFAAALVTTHLWFPTRYWDVVALEPVGWLVLVRDLLLIALVAVLARALTLKGRARGAPRSA